MNSTHSEAQVTQSGQAIRINNSTAMTLSSLFSTCIGPFGSYKALISPGQTLRIVKEGNMLCKEIQFTHPTSVIITRAATSMYSTFGDGSSSLIVMCSEIFSAAFRQFCDGVAISRICNSLQLCLNDVMGHIKSAEKPYEEGTLRMMAYYTIRTKVDEEEAHKLAQILAVAVENVSQSPYFDVNMVEVIKMQEGDVSETVYVDGLVLDHGGRHYGMPSSLEDVCILVTNMSLEYEKPEINAEFCYSSSRQRDELAEKEREFILQKARAIAEFGKRLKEVHGKSLLVVTEKGIDPYSLEVFAEAGVLALRRAKRRNLERLVRMCGGSVITQIGQMNEKVLGYCKKVSSRKIGEDVFTFVEGTPFKGSCTILIRGNSQHEMSRMESGIKGALKSLHVSMKDKTYIEGGLSLYRSLVLYVRSRLDVVSEKDVVGYKIMESVFLSMMKILLKNSGMDVQDELIKILRGAQCASVIDNFSVVSSVISNATVVASSLLLVDEIIKAGKPIKESKPENN
ncbi:subunit zeta of T-complex protein 1 [Ordospora colligata]|uniref:Subunit zeta of T-complex protein 1 n=1 Tax=Ordospora colligata OC4 TaxID=1354746 RepID=A0A0B2UJL6_9MICR|nr:subunit zeta of T-complex protein 1 [Ordospora colligata OC4]KHN69553.1 subunit zeta of T-complex protein 1 [Ordospora colligata OC4]TBU15373.1 subunit zeta of T-complex protein 1 [Ordospora colligata]TBU15473.1 subunit zeta of T-complex protein 1 [Ordospora colligata]TBU18569.1 subunit zeta of T-complex protein 1 [Ordospora colligata]